MATKQRQYTGQFSAGNAFVFRGQKPQVVARLLEEETCSRITGNMNSLASPKIRLGFVVYLMIVGFVWCIENK